MDNDVINSQLNTETSDLGNASGAGDVTEQSMQNVDAERISEPDTASKKAGTDNPDDDIQQQKKDKKIEKQEKKTAESSAKTIKKLKNSEKSVKRYQFFIIRLIIILVILWVLFFKIVGITHMPNGDMYPRIDQGDFILFYRLEKNFKSQDVVVIEKVTPESNGKKQIFVCRVVAVAGDTVEVTDNQHLIVNGNTMVESNIFYQTPRYEGFTEYPITLKEGEIFVLSDMRNGGHDSRYFGTVDKNEVIGTVITILRRNGI